MDPSSITCDQTISSTVFVDFYCIYNASRNQTRNSGRPQEARFHWTSPSWHLQPLLSDPLTAFSSSARQKPHPGWRCTLQWGLPCRVRPAPSRCGDCACSLEKLWPRHPSLGILCPEPTTSPRPCDTFYFLSSGEFDPPFFPPWPRNTLSDSLHQTPSGPMDGKASPISSGDKFTSPLPASTFPIPPCTPCLWLP